MQPANHYISNLTPLRGMAAIWVVVFHIQETLVKFVNPDSTKLLVKGYLMVDLFFIMSGFIIYHVYQNSFTTGISGKKFREFTVARFARIYPLHLLTLIFCIVIFVPKFGWDQVDDPKAIPTNLLLIHSFGIHKIFTWNVPSWSISAEWWAYMVFPFLCLFLSRNKKLAIPLLLIFVVLVYLGIIYWIPRKSFMDPKLPALHNLDSTFDFGFLRGLAGFVFGMLVYQFYQSGVMRKFFQSDLVALLVILSTMLCLYFGLHDEYVMIFFSLVVFVFAINNGVLHKICNNRILQYLGKISYSIYLMQFFPIIPFWFGLKVPGFIYGKESAHASFLVGSVFSVFFLLVLIGLSSLSYYFVEKPCRIWINKRWGKEKMPVYA